MRAAVVLGCVLPLPRVAYAQDVEQPTATEVRSWSPPLFDWATYGFGVADPDPLDVRVQWAVGQLYAVTGRTLESITSLEEVAIAQKVLAAFTVMEAMGGGTAALAVLEQPWLKSFTAGSYSETRFSPSEIAGGQSKSPPYPAALWALLWALMTDEKKDDWIRTLTGQNAPAVAYVAEDWGEDVGDTYGGLVFGPGVTHGWPWGP